jgi:hypothetical protein
VPRAGGAQLAQVAQHPVQAVALDELHGVVVNALGLADAEDGHDVAVVQPRRRLRLAAEALRVTGMGPRVRRQDFQGDAAAERDLLGFVDDAHAAAATSRSRRYSPKRSTRS